jgi:hypothetical protein
MHAFHAIGVPEYYFDGGHTSTMLKVIPSFGDLSKSTGEPEQAQ